MARTARRKAKTSAEPDGKHDYDGLSGQPPPPPDMDPSGAGYASYAPPGVEYGSHDLGPGGHHGSPGGGRLSASSPQTGNRAYFPSAGAPGGAADYVVDEQGHQVQHLPPLSEALHPDDHHAYPQTSSYDTSHHGDASAHASYDQGSSNFFDPQIMEAPAPAGTADSRHGSIHGANGNGAGAHYNGAIMTPPPPATAAGSHAYASSPYQPNHNPQMFHRASISGPIMHNHYGAQPGTPSAASTHSAAGAPPAAGDMAAWGTPSGSARPHTADGMFGSQMGGLPTQWAGPGMNSDYNRAPRGSNASMTSLNDGHSSTGKVFSYMPSNGDDSSSVGGSGSQNGSNSKKRPRRRYDEIERLYPCNWAGCQKSYGTLNHLNAHVAMQKHGSKRSPGEFKEMRKAWRKSKREDEQRRQANQAAANEEVLSRSKMMFNTAPNQPFMPHGGYPVGSFGGQPPPHVMPPPGQVPRYSMHPQQASVYGGGAGGVYPSHVSSFDASGRAYPSSSPHQQGAAQAQQGTSGLGAYLMAHRGSI